MSRKEYANCIFARKAYDPHGHDHGYSCGACKRHYCLIEDGNCAYYKSKFMYKMEWVQGAGNENIQIPVPRGTAIGGVYAGNKKKKAAV